MLYREIIEAGSCNPCPLYEELCPGGMRCYGGDPIEPPCYGWDDDTDVDEWYHNAVEGQRRYEEAEDRRIAEKKAKEEKNRIAAVRRREAKWHVYAETKEIKTLKRKIAAIEELSAFADVYANAVNMTNEMFRYDERVKKSDSMLAIEAQIEPLKKRISELELIRKQKLEELRQGRKEQP